MTPPPPALDGSSATARKIGFFLGPMLFLLTFLVPAPEQMAPQAWTVSGLAMWMAAWWITEAMPLPVAALLPVIILPTLKIMPLKEVTAPFASSIIFLFLGGFIISLAMEKWKLHLRFGLGILKVLGVGPKSALAGMMLATAFMGMWISNTATTILMLPMAISLALLLGRKSDSGELPTGANYFAKAMVLGVGYSAVIGGLSTFVGTPTNAVLKGHMQKTYGYDFSLADWMSFGVPLMLIMLLLAWCMLCSLFVRHAATCDNTREVVRDEYAKLGRMRCGERVVTAVFVLIATFWVLRRQMEMLLGIPLDDAVVALIGAMILFLTPLNRQMSQFALTWKDTDKLPWGVLIFFGGSLSISDALTKTGVTAWISLQLDALNGSSLVLVVGIIVLLIILASEMMNNVATITAFLPILSGLAAGMDVNPLLILVPATLAASCGFMLPGASAPNALAFGTGYLKVRDMIRAGFLLDIISALFVILATFTLMSWAFGVEPGVVPDWAHMAPK